MLKRTFDIIVSLAGLAVLALPMLLIAAWIRMDSPGPAIFRQERVGRRGQLFQIRKFRTMHLREGPDRPLTLAQDERVTTAGAWLRARRVDEWPQLLDVLQGHMSLVGPRPEVPRYVEAYPPHLRGIVLSVRPGITDPAALAYRNEASLLLGTDDPERVYREQILPGKLRIQADYIERANLWADIKVLCDTARVLIRGR